MAETLVLGGGWTQEVRAICADRCAEEFGDPPCWSLVGDDRMGDTPNPLMPCADCLLERTTDV